MAYAIRHCFFTMLLLVGNGLQAQNYQAIHGSSFAGSLGVASNPASIAHVPYAWDFTPLSIQLKQTTNALAINNASLLSFTNAITVAAQNGVKERFLLANQDVHLLNARIRLHSGVAIAFGANLRSSFFIKTNTINFQDTTKGVADFVGINSNHLPLSLQGAANSWMEYYGTYSQTLMEQGNRLLNAGITLKLNRSLAGAYTRLQNINYLPTSTSSQYSINSGEMELGYPESFDAPTNVNTFLQKSNTGFSVDLGMEYLWLTDEDKPVGGDYAYETKLGIAVLDIGRSKYRYGADSYAAGFAGAGILDSVLQSKVNGTASLRDFKDSMASIASTFNSLAGSSFSIYHPTRLLVNVDQHIANNFFVNVELTLPLISVFSKNTLKMEDMNLLAVTPRWELESLGAYLPVTYNNRNQLWVGAAFKLGPLLLGTHNLANVFSSTALQTGGFYMALTVRPGPKHSRSMPATKATPIISNKQSLGCPKS